MENAELYSCANGMQKKDAKEIFSEFRDKLQWPKQCKILDVGCGSGEVTTEILLPLLPKDFRELVALDISLEMIQHARNLHSHPKVSFIQFDIAQNSNALSEELNKAVVTSQMDTLKAQNILKSNGSYDIISSFYCLHWISDQRLAIRNIKELLSPGGEALLVFLAKSPIFTLYRKLANMELWREYMQDVDSFIPFYQDLDDPVNKFKEIVKNEQLKISTVDCRERSYVFENSTALRNAITAVNPFLSRIPNHLQDEFISDCLRQTKILKLTEYKNNCYRVNYKLIVAHIKKPYES